MPRGVHPRKRKAAKAKRRSPHYRHPAHYAAKAQPATAGGLTRPGVPGEALRKYVKASARLIAAMLAEIEKPA